MNIPQINLEYFQPCTQCKFTRGSDACKQVIQEESLTMIGTLDGAVHDMFGCGKVVD